jgi:hypothetical protein
MSFDYKKYSFENLEKWVEDAINSSGASPQEIYDVIKSVVLDNYYTYKNRTEHCYELLALLNGNGVDHVSNQQDKSPESQKAWTSFWEENYYPEEHKKFEEPTVEDLMPPWGHSDMEALRYTEEQLNEMCSKVEPKHNKVTKWLLPVQQQIEEGIDNYFIQLPDDLLDQVNWKENDQLIWIDRKDGTFELRKI